MGRHSIEPEHEVDSGGGRTDHYELGRYPSGASFEQLAIEYDADSLVRAFVLRS
jgi:hypothetical protein